MTLPMTATTGTTNISEYKALGVTQCNWQLFKEDIEDPAKAVQRMKDFGLEVVSLHSPFDGKRTAPMLEYFSLTEFQPRVLRAAEEICTLLNKRLPIVFHSGLSYYEMPLIPTQIDALGRVMQECPHVDVLIENVGMGYPISFYPFDIPKMIPETVRRFNELLPRPIYSCLDICHTEMVARIGALLQREGIAVSDEVPTVEAFFREFSESCRLVHFANTRGYGSKRGEHGVGFTTDERDKLQAYLDLCRKYVPQATIVLEISEVDYEHRPNLVDTLHTLEQCH